MSIQQESRTITPQTKTGPVTVTPLTGPPTAFPLAVRMRATPEKADWYIVQSEQTVPCRLQVDSFDDTVTAEWITEDGKVEKLPEMYHVDSTTAAYVRVSNAKNPSEEPAPYGLFVHPLEYGQIRRMVPYLKTGCLIQKKDGSLGLIHDLDYIPLDNMLTARDGSRHRIVDIPLLPDFTAYGGAPPLKYIQSSPYVFTEDGKLHNIRIRLEIGEIFSTQVCNLKSSKFTQCSPLDNAIMSPYYEDDENKPTFVCGNRNWPLPDRELLHIFDATYFDAKKNQLLHATRSQTDSTDDFVFEKDGTNNVKNVFFLACNPRYPGHLSTIVKEGIGYEGKLRKGTDYVSAYYRSEYSVYGEYGLGLKQDGTVEYFTVEPIRGNFKTPLDPIRVNLNITDVVALYGHIMIKRDGSVWKFKFVDAQGEIGELERTVYYRPIRYHDPALLLKSDLTPDDWPESSRNQPGILLPQKKGVKRTLSGVIDSADDTDSIVLRSDNYAKYRVRVTGDISSLQLYKNWNAISAVKSEFVLIIPKGNKASIRLQHKYGKYFKKTAYSLEFENITDDHPDIHRSGIVHLLPKKGGAPLTIQGIIDDIEDIDCFDFKKQENYGKYEIMVSSSSENLKIRELGAITIPMNTPTKLILGKRQNDDVSFGLSYDKTKAFTPTRYTITIKNRSDDHPDIPEGVVPIKLPAGNTLSVTLPGVIDDAEDVDHFALAPQKAGKYLIGLNGNLKNIDCKKDGITFATPGSLVELSGNSFQSISVSLAQNRYTQTLFEKRNYQVTFSKYEAAEKNETQAIQIIAGNIYYVSVIEEDNYQVVQGKMKFNPSELELISCQSELNKSTIGIQNGELSFSKEWSPRTGLVSLVKFKALMTGTTTLQLVSTI